MVLYVQNKPNCFLTKIIKNGDEKMVRILKTSSGKEVNTNGINEAIKVVQTPITNPEVVNKFIIEELRELRKKGYLTALRGNRMTDLSRNVSEEISTFIKNNCHNILFLIKETEKWLGLNPDLFIRVIKFDEARFSSTSPKEDTSDQNLHFDAGKSSFFEWQSSIPQFFLNVGSTRFFRVYPVPLNEMITSAVEHTNLTLETIEKMPVSEILSWHQKVFKEKLKEIKVPNGAMVIFDGRRFAHDAGKWPMEGRRLCEPDVTLALDLKSNMYNQIQYKVNSGFLK